MSRGKRKITAAYLADTEGEIFRLAESVSLWQKKRIVHRRGRADLRRRIIQVHWGRGSEAPIDRESTLETCECRLCAAWRKVDARLGAIKQRLNHACIRLGVLSIRRREILKSSATEGFYMPGDCQGQAVMPFAKEESA